VKWYAVIGGVIRITQQIGMIKSSASIIQEDLNLGANRVSGLRAGPVAEENGMNQVVHGVTIGVIQNQQ
jgi:hypothetical protein